MKLDTLADGEFVQVVVGVGHADLLSKVLYDATERFIGDGSPGEQAVAGLAQFFADVAANPRSFPVTGRYATSIRNRRRNMRKLGL